MRVPAMDEEGRKVIEGHLIAMGRAVIGLTGFRPCNAKLDVCCCGRLRSRHYRGLLGGGSPLKGRKTKKRTRERERGLRAEEPSKGVRERENHRANFTLTR
ncbi:Uncharacterized protein DBV15_05035 [Temnothorax longispinosus]|uniref:Uncharacterized protein n=1 Tax=Temnothorax longispinosus TaxID=300112 RepID=A0A4S2KIJ9_9HYME|nr:Uncharacterized protein DBV15_05035 [Temnothorax longispinosus]